MERPTRSACFPHHLDDNPARDPDSPGSSLLNLDLADFEEVLAGS